MLKYVGVFLVFMCSFLFFHADAQVLNKGVSGNSTAQLLQRINNDVIRESPDMVVLMVGTIDFLNCIKIEFDFNAQIL